MLLQCFSWSFRRHRQLTGLNPCSNGIWSLTYAWTKNSVIRWRVLILVLMEYGLWHGSDGAQPLHAQVLILVLMEYGLWRWSLLCIVSLVLVLILVLMEYGLWHEWQTLMPVLISLNPCSNGIWSLTLLIGIARLSVSSLNPCSNGIWSLTMRIRTTWLCSLS